MAGRVKRERVGQPPREREQATPRHAVEAWFGAVVWPAHGVATTADAVYLLSDGAVVAHVQQGVRWELSRAPEFAPDVWGLEADISFQADEASYSACKHPNDE